VRLYIQTQSFINNVYGLVSTFFVISIFWVLYSKILDYLREVDDMVILTSFIFFILVLLVPAFSNAQFQYRNLLSVISLALLQIINGSLLLLLWTYLDKRRRQLMNEKGQELSIHVVCSINFIAFFHLISKRCQQTGHGMIIMNPWLNGDEF
jgi:uncharacterized membrane protein